MQSEQIRAARLAQDHSEELAAKGFYHSFELPDGSVIDGVISPERLHERYRRFPIPGDLHGKRVLDIGAWDGWFTFEAERHGAAVTAIDCVEVDHFLALHRKMQSKADYRTLEVYELGRAGLGTFDIVFFLGVLYHLRHPLLALEIVCSLTTDVAIVESFVSDGDGWEQHAGEIPTMEFYEGTELANQFDNWSGPSVTCLMAMCRAAGFARVELLRTEPYNALIACYRKWEDPPAHPTAAPPYLASVVEGANQGRNISMSKEHYLSCWFGSSRAAIAPGDLRLEVAGLGVAAHYCSKAGQDGWLANFALPRGLSPGWKEARLRFADSGFSNPVRIAVDMPLKVDRIVCRGVTDPATWKHDEVRATETSFATSWVTGLPENADIHNVKVWLGEQRLRVHFLSEPDEAGVVQINAAVPRDTAHGEYGLRVVCGGVSSEPWPVRIT